MLARTHFLAGAAAGALTGVPANAIAAGLSSLLPDADCARSWIGRRAPVASWGAELLFGHRGFFHSLLGALAAGWLVPALLGRLGLAVSREAVLAGYLSHLALDTLTPGGVPWLWPLPRGVSLPLVRTGGALEKLVVAPSLFVLAGYLAWRAFL